MKFPNIFEILYLYDYEIVRKCVWIVSVVWYTHKKKSKDSISYFQASLSQSQGLFNSFVNIKRKLIQLLTSLRKEKIAPTRALTLK